VARKYQFILPPDKVRLTLVAKEADRAETDAATLHALVTRAQERADTLAAQAVKKPKDTKLQKAKLEADAQLRQYQQRAEKQEAYAGERRTAAQQLIQQIARNEQALRDAQTQILQNRDVELQAVRQQLAEVMQAQLATWRAQQHAAIAQQIANCRAQLEAENAPPAETPPARALTYPEMKTRPLDVPTDRMHIAVNQADFQAFRTRLDAVRAIDSVVHQLTLDRLALKKEMQRDTQQAAMSVAEQHGWTVQCDLPSGKDVTGNVRTWLTEYWPSQPGQSDLTRK
jgi:hypothetical protein